MSEVPSSLTGMAVPAALYVNSVRIDYTQWDVTVDLLLITPAGDIPAEAGSQTTYATERVTRVIMSPMHAKALAESLGEAVKMWGGQIRPASRGWCVMTAGRGTEAVPFYSGSTASTSQVGAAGIVQPVVHPISGVMVPPPGPDRVAEWLHGEEASQHQGQWVALDADEGRFLAVVDDIRDRPLWRARGALIIYVILLKTKADERFYETAVSLHLPGGPLP